jgi:hypothetical protein
VFSRRLHEQSPSRLHREPQPPHRACHSLTHSLSLSLSLPSFHYLKPWILLLITTIVQFIFLLSYRGHWRL